jgi:hypothetical protein
MTPTPKIVNTTSPGRNKGAGDKNEIEDDSRSFAILILKMEFVPSTDEPQ